MARWPLLIIVASMDSVGSLYVQTIPPSPTIYLSTVTTESSRAPDGFHRSPESEIIKQRLQALRKASTVYWRSSRLTTPTNGKTWHSTF